MASCLLAQPHCDTLLLHAAALASGWRALSFVQRSLFLRRHHGQQQRACSRDTRCRGPDETPLGAQDAAVAGFREAVAAEQPFSLAMQLRSAGARAPVLRMVFRRAAPPCPADPLREMDLVAGRRLSQAVVSCTRGARAVAPLQSVRHRN